MIGSLATASVGLVTVGALGISSRTGWVQNLLQGGKGPQRPAFQLQEISKKVGVSFVHQKAVLDHKLDNIMPWMSSVGACVAAADYNNDGHVDIFASSSGRNAPCHLFRNNGDGTFTDVAQEAGLVDLNLDGAVMDAVWGDFDNDGWIDLYIVKWSTANRLFRNNRNGTFTDITEASGTGDTGNGNSAIWFDYDGDGRLDLYIGNYFPQVDLWNIPTTKIMHNDFEQARNGGPNVLYHNNGDGTFTNVAPQLGVDDRGWTLDVGACDLFNTGRMDLYLANDFGQDVLYKNNGDGTFTNITHTAIPIDTRKGMNVDFADLDGDGYPDIYVVNITKQGYLVEGNFLWKNNRDGTFTDHAPALGVDNGGWGWAAKFIDLDNDGEMEIVALNGFVSAGQGDYWYFLGTMATTPGIIVEDAKNWPAIGTRSISGYERSRLFVKEGGSYVEIAEVAGLNDLYDGRGLCIADFDNDGLPEMFIANQGAPFQLYKNYPQQKNQWIGFHLTGSGKSNRDAIGARVTVKAGKKTWVKWVDPGSGYASQSDRRLIFGLGSQTRIDSVEIRWPDGQIEQPAALALNRYHQIQQGGQI
ncbi:RNA-binding protein [Tengunoibacter tsumagoiensis]|uniref:RNA-binding protein n=2 Tax=Tengunoibacter tsumagoiensis TaxID=2014871 RepID=A0A402A9K9_9CHLR|nr:RNA-binding protein [Tengunoibacter tsumagoiensis]